jgi:heme/copper-type cytochrome/quinol oxidase subunit 1
MKNRLRPILTEALWLIISAFLSIILAKFLFGWTDFKGSIDIPLHDTYLVFSSWFVLLPLFSFMTFNIYFFKEKYKSFNRAIPNWIIIVSGLALMISLTLIIKTISDFAGFITGGWTSYPPLSALPNQEQHVVKEITLPTLISNFLILIQLIIVSMLLYTTYRWGTTKNDDKK